MPKIPKKHRTLFTEAINRTELDAVMLRHGYIPFLPVIDVGIDVIYYREADSKLRFVQAKGRVCIEQKYNDRQIEIAFSEDGQWYLYPHDGLVKFCEANSLWVHTNDWRDNGKYSVGKVPPAMREWIDQWKIN